MCKNRFLLCVGLNLINLKLYANELIPEVNQKLNLSINDVFKNAEEIGQNKPNLNKIQKLCYVDHKSQTPQTFFSCPTRGDGNCFFHAVFTQYGQDANEVSKLGNKKREKLYEEIQNSDYSKNLRPLVYEYYLGLLVYEPNHSEVPEKIKNLIKEKNNYTEKYSTSSVHCDEYNLNPEVKYKVEDIQNLITHDDIIKYMKRYKSNSGGDSFIPVRPETTCVAEIMAQRENVNINIFTFNERTKKIDLLKSIKTSDSKDIHILLHSNHFTRLYKLEESDEHYKQAIQIMKNANFNIIK